MGMRPQDMRKLMQHFPLPVVVVSTLTQKGSRKAIEALADKSLIRLATDRAGGMRVDLLETIHTFARDRLELSSEHAAVRRSHASYFADRVEEAERRGAAAVREMGGSATNDAGGQAADRVQQEIEILLENEEMLPPLCPYCRPQLIL